MRLAVYAEVVVPVEAPAKSGDVKMWAELALVDAGFRVLRSWVTQNPVEPPESPVASEEIERLRAALEGLLPVLDPSEWNDDTPPTCLVYLTTSWGRVQSAHAALGKPDSRSEVEP